MRESYFDIAGSAETYKEGLELAKKEGYTHLYRWGNSDLNWTFLAKSYDDAYNEAVALYMFEKKEKNKEFAEEYFDEYVDIIDIYCELENL